MFVGTFEHSLDDKGRLVLPTSFRGRLTDGGFLAQHENCLALWSGEEFRTFVERVMEKQRNQEVTPDAVRVLTASAAEAKPDGQGRISIPPRLRGYAELSSEVVLIGAFDHVELWSPVRWEAVSLRGGDSLADAVANKGIF